MLDPTEAKDLVDDVFERFEKREAKEARGEKRFRDRVSLLVGVFAVMLAIVHLIGAGYLRENVVDTIRASDTYNYMQAKKIRQTVLQTGAINAPPGERARLLAEADLLDRPDARKHGIAQLQAAADELTRDGVRAGEAGERYEWAETALQMAIVLLSIAMIASSRLITIGACLIAGGGLAIALLTYLKILA